MKSQNIDFLDNEAENLDENSAINFFNKSINLLNNPEVSITIKYKIISSLVKSLSSQANIELFINGNYLSKVPFKLFNAQEKILDIVYIITSYSPNGITNSVAHNFGHLITRYPRKCLNILSLFAERFQITFNPWEMIDLLFKYCDTFILPMCVDDYISVLSYLNANFQSFKEDRIKHTWFAYCQIIKKCELDFPKAKAYYAMCQLYELRPRIIKKCPFPESTPDDLLNPTLQKSVISLLLRCAPNQIEEPTIQSLLKIKNESCFLALSLLAENQECAKILANDLSWLQENIPTSEGTMQIFIKLLNSPYVRYDLVRSPEVVTYLNNIVNNGNNPEKVDNQSLISSSAIVRSLPINRNYVLYLSKEDFLSNYFNAALQRTEKPVVDSTLLLIDAASKLSEVVEFSDVCDFVKENVLNGDPVASRAAVNLSRYPRCAKEFKNNGLADYFAKNANIPNSSGFLSNYRKSVKQQVKAPPVVSSLPNRRPLNNSMHSNRSPIGNIKQEPEKIHTNLKSIKSRGINLPEPEKENPKKREQKIESENEKISRKKSESEIKSVKKSYQDSETESDDVTEQENIRTKNINSKAKQESEPESEQELVSKSGSDSGPLPVLKSKNTKDASILSEDSSDDDNDDESSSTLKKISNEKHSNVPTPERSNSNSVHTSVKSSPSASGVNNPVNSPNSRARSSPIEQPNVEIEEEEEESESLSLTKNQNNGIQSSKSDIDEPSEKFTSSILKNRAHNSDDSSTSETDNINPSISPIKQKNAVLASPLNKSKVRGIASFGSFGNLSDTDEIKKSPSIISVDLPPPEQHTQHLLPDSFGGLSYIKQGSPPPKPRPSRNKE